MKSIGERLQELKDKMLTCDDFSESYTFFFDVLANESDFLAAGKRVKHPMLKKTIKSIGEHILKEDVRVEKLILKKLKKHKFYHGPFFIGGRMAGFFYFGDIDMGMIYLVKSRTHESLIVHFSCIEDE